MSNSRRQRQRDEQLLIDFILGRCDQAQAEEVARRLGGDPQFAKLHDDVDRTFAALRALPEPAAPEDLTQRTLAAITHAAPKQRPASRHDLSRRRSVAPTFSLRELAGIAAAIILMVAAFLPFVRESQSRKDRNLCAMKVGQMGSELQQYAYDHGNVLPAANSKHLRWLAGNGEPPASNSAGLFKLVKEGYAPMVLFVCPAVRVRPVGYRLDSSVSDFPSADAINYSYNHALGGQRISLDDTRLAGVADQMAILSDATPVFESGRFHRDRIMSSSLNHGARGQNVLYLSGHVAWAETPAAGVGGNNIYLIEGVDDYRGDESPAEPTDSFLLPAYASPLTD